MATLLAEVPHSGTYWFTPAEDHPLGFQVTWTGDTGGMIRKAARLTILRLVGPDYPVRCDAHLLLDRKCHRIPVGSALLGRRCDL